MCVCLIFILKFEIIDVKYAIFWTSAKQNIAFTDITNTEKTFKIENKKIDGNVIIEKLVKAT